MSSMTSKSILCAIIFDRLAYGKRSTKSRQGRRRTIKRQDQRAAAQNIASQLADMQDQQDSQKHAVFLAKSRHQQLVELTESLFSQDNWLYVDEADTQIETALCGQEDYPHMLAFLDEFPSIEAEMDHLDMYRHASHLPEKHLVDAVEITMHDISEPDVILADPEGLRLGSKLSQSGSVYGKARPQPLTTAA